MIKAATDKHKTDKPAEGYFFAVAEKMLSQLPERSREILKKRFGLADNFTIQTLEKIGSDYGITRERVRQIISDAKKSVIKRSGEAEFSKAESRLIFTIDKKHGIIKEEDILKELDPAGSLSERNAMRFLSDCSSKIKVIGSKDGAEKVWIVSDEVLAKAKRVLEEARSFLEKNRKLFGDEEISRQLADKLGDFSPKEVLSHLEVLSDVKKNKFGRWGLSHWPEITPKGSREKIYLVLKEEKKPLHFTQIAKLIEKYKLGHKRVHPQTIHNELIKDERFVLIGRGIYALAEWGYSGGAVKDVIKKVLEKSGRPLDREEIVKQVLEMRKVKRTTIMINLNSGEFERAGAVYALKK